MAQIPIKFAPKGCKKPKISSRRFCRRKMHVAITSRRLEFPALGHVCSVSQSIITRITICTPHYAELTPYRRVPWHPRPGICGAHSSSHHTHTTSGHSHTETPHTVRCETDLHTSHSHTGYPTRLSRTGAHILVCVTVTCPPADTYDTQHTLHPRWPSTPHNAAQHITNSSHNIHAR